MAIYGRHLSENLVTIWKPMQAWSSANFDSSATSKSEHTQAQAAIPELPEGPIGVSHSGPSVGQKQCEETIVYR